MAASGWALGLKRFSVRGSVLAAAANFNRFELSRTVLDLSGGWRHTGGECRLGITPPRWRRRVHRLREEPTLAEPRRSPTSLRATGRTQRRHSRGRNVDLHFGGAGRARRRRAAVGALAATSLL